MERIFNGTIAHQPLLKTAFKNIPLSTNYTKMSVTTMVKYFILNKDFESPSLKQTG